MVDVVLPPGSSVILEPAQTVKFHLQHDTAPQTVLTLYNASEDGLVAFKVKTKRPDSYLVQPHQGFIEPNGTASVTLVLLQEECNTLLQFDTIQRRRVNDKFLVQNVEVDRSFYARSKRRTSKEMASELSRMWRQVGRQSISSKELVCFFYQNSEDELQQLQQQLRQSRGDLEDTDKQDDNAAKCVTSTRISAHEQGTKSYSQKQDVVMLRRKYDELMVVVAQLTMKRDALANDLATTQQQLQQVSIHARDVWEALAQQENQRAIAFKVMTTRPLGYLVQPNQGVLNPNCSLSVVIILQCDQMLLQDMLNDEFLVQSVDIGAGFFDLSKLEPRQDMDNKLLNLWIQKDRQVLCNQKLPCYFVGNKQGEAKPAGTAVTSLSQSSRLGIPPVRFEWAINDADVRLKWKKRDKLKKLVAQLTDERDKLISDLSKTHQRLERAAVETERLNADLEEASSFIL